MTEYRRLLEIKADVWEQRKLPEFVSFFNGLTYTPDDVEETGTLVLRSSNVKNGEIVDADNVYVNDKVVTSENVHEGDIIVVVRNGSRALIGKHAQIKASMPNTVIGAFMSGMRSEHSSFVNALLDTSAFENEIAKNMGATINQITGYMFSKMEFMIPSGDEQQKIGEHFQSLDNLITLHQRITPYFLKINAFVWEQRKLGDLVDRVTRKNQDLVSELPLTISAQYGLIDQNEFFDKRVASKDVSGYYLIENGEFAYNKSTSTDAPWGAIKRLDRYENGVLSTLYIVFGIKENNPIDSDFLVSYYSTNLWHKGIHEIATEGARNHGLLNIAPADFFETKLMIPQDIEEQKKIGKYFEELERLITLHQRKPYFWNKFIVIDWEQRKLGDSCKLNGRIGFRGYTEKDIISKEAGGVLTFSPTNIVDNKLTIECKNTYITREKYDESPEIKISNGDILFVKTGSTLGKSALVAGLKEDASINPQIVVMRVEKDTENFMSNVLITDRVMKQVAAVKIGGAVPTMTETELKNFTYFAPAEKEEKKKIGDHFRTLDNLITLHHHKLFIINGLKLFTVMQCKCHLLLNISNKNKKTIKEIKLMPELERVIEEKLIDQLVYGDSQWTYREDLKTEEDLWRNFKYILEQNNKDRLNGESLSDAEFEQVKNQLQFSSFYKAGEWLVGENGKVMVHVQRDTEKLHLVVMNHEHIAGGSSVYEVINQYSALKDEDDYYTVSRNRRFDVTLMINGLPMIHIELKNRQHSYMDGFNQIKKYISEGKFTGIFSAVQMFVVSNGVDTKYFAAASDTDLNAKFMSGWVDEKNNPVSDYLDFAKSVLRIPEAHEMIARYTVLDRDAKRLIILRPYQIHAIESIREASKIGKSGFVWHTTGSGKTLTSYKATRNLLMDIPSLDKTIFLIDRKDLDTQTSSAFQAYANNDVIAVDKTDNVNDLKKKLKSGDRKVIVTTIQKMQILVTKRLQEDTPEYNKIKNLRIAFVVDECHRAVTPKTKRELERFFGRSLWFGFTGTPRFAENPYAQMGDLPRTTEELYGKCLHKYTIQNAIKDNAVLGFQVEHNGPKNMEDETDPSLYDNETHMLRVLDIILNKSYQKFGLQNGKGQTYEAILTTSSIQLAQKYYELLSKVKNGETDLEIDERMRKVLPDYPKFAITYSVTENEEGSHVNQEKMQKSLNDYNEMFGTKFDLSQIQSYNENLNKRLARKDKKYKSRNRQLDLVIVVDRLLTGFDAPCLSTIFIDRQPMGPHDLIQAFSRTNRIFDPNKAYGQIVTFQAPVLFKECVDNAVKLYSAGSTEVALLAEWDKVEPAFKRALSALKAVAETPDEETDMSLKELKVFAKAFQTFDRLFAQIKSFTQYDESMLEDYGITEEEYEDYVGHYQNAMTKIKLAEPDDPQTPPEAEETVDTDYELMAYSSTKIDYEYIINLIQNIVTPDEDAEAVTPEERQKQIDEVKQYIEEMRKDNPKVADIMTTLVNEIEQDENKYKGQSIMNIVENMKHDCINQVVTDFCVTWYASKDDVMYAALHYRNGEIPNESVIKSTINYTRYKESQEKALPKFKYYSQCMAELRKILDEEIKPLITVS
ncbi:type I restriction endonuclease subunit R, EcoR124 family [[Ruminococcus] torques]|uniref:type I restriction endonuclease subunit R, EcoR124 family n=1 Tax=[Ruminococcus] torques TaxID=33039 RepID=UPI003C12FF40